MGYSVLCIMVCLYASHSFIIVIFSFTTLTQHFRYDHGIDLPKADITRDLAGCTIRRRIPYYTAELKSCGFRGAIRTPESRVLEWLYF